MQLKQIQAKLAQGSLQIANFCPKSTENWAICGTSGSGKTALIALLTGELKSQCTGIIHKPNASFVVCQDTFEQFLQQERLQDESDLTDVFTQGQSVRTYLNRLCKEAKWQHLLANALTQLAMQQHLDTGICALSTGEGQKLLWLMALLFDMTHSQAVLIFDEPFAGIDAASVQVLKKLLTKLYQQRQNPILYCTSQANTLPYEITHLLYLQQQQSLFAGTLANAQNTPELAEFFTPKQSVQPLPEAKNGQFKTGDTLVRLQQVSIQYGQRQLFKPLNWHIQAGQHWLIQGENGCGKTSLLELITGDNPQVYTNHVEVFGLRRGQGESIWQVKQHIGIVSGHLHSQYRTQTSAINVLLSGFFDSIGLYQKASTSQRNIALNWLERLNLKAQQHTSVQRLSKGQQRQLLIARALIKQPALLILDEPTNGLDSHSRLQFLHFIQQLTKLQHTSVLLVSHASDRFSSYFSNQLNYHKPTQEFRIVKGQDR